MVASMAVGAGGEPFIACAFAFTVFSHHAFVGCTAIRYTPALPLPQFFQNFIGIQSAVTNIFVTLLFVVRVLHTLSQQKTIEMNNITNSFAVI